MMSLEILNNESSNSRNYNFKTMSNFSKTSETEATHAHLYFKLAR